MGRRDFQSTVADALPRVIKEQAKFSVGSIKFTKKDKKTIGKVYLRAGAIYGIELTTYSPSIVSRIVTNEYISEKNRSQVINKYESNLKDTSVVEFVLKYQIFPEKPLMSYIKDYFFDAFDELYQWEEVNVEWRPNEEPSPSVLKVPNSSPDEIIEKLQLREKFLRENISQEWSIHPRDLDDVGYVKNFDYEDPDYTNYLLLSFADETSLTIGQVADYLGLSRFNTKLALFKLWQAGAIDVLHPSGIRYSNRSEEEIQKAQQEDVRKVEPVVEETISVEATREEEPEVEVPEIEEFETPDELEDTLAEPTPVIETPDYDIPVVPLTSYPSEYVAPEPSKTDLPDFNETYQDDYSAPELIQPNIEEEMSDTAPVGTASRLRSIAEQLKRELNLLKQGIQDAQSIVSDKKQNIATLHSERAILVTKLKELDGRITEENNSVAVAQEEVNRLQAEYDDGIQLLN